MKYKTREHSQLNQTFSRIAGALFLLLCCASAQLRAQDAALPLPEGRQESAYEFKFEAEGSIGATTWRVAGGELPPGLTLDVSGRLHGVPIKAQNDAYRFVVEVIDGASTPRRFAQTFALFIQPVPLRIKTPTALRIRQLGASAALAPIVAPQAIAQAAAMPSSAPLVGEVGNGAGSVSSAIAPVNNSAPTQPRLTHLAPPPAAVHVEQVELHFTANDQDLQKFSVKVTGPDGRQVTQVSNVPIPRSSTNAAHTIVNLQMGRNTIILTATGEGVADATLNWVITRQAAVVTEEIRLLTAPTEGDTRVCGANALPNAEIKIVRGDAEPTTTLQADDKGRFCRYPPADRQLNSGEDISFKQKASGANSFSAASPPFTVETIEQKDELRSGSAQGYLFGGLVLSQQAREFKQADPFFGFEAGYRIGMKRRKAIYQRTETDAQGNPISQSYKLRVGADGVPLDNEGYRLIPVRAATTGVFGQFICNGRPCQVYKVTKSCLNISETACHKEALVRETDEDGEPRKGTEKFSNGWGQFQFRFFGLFQSAPRAVSEQGVPRPTTFQPFIASRQSFDTGLRFWWEAPRFSRFFTLGGYGMWGGSTVMSKTELEGETALVEGREVGNPDKVCKFTETQNSGGTDTCRISVDNDVKQFKEVGLLMKVDLFNRKLFLESTLGYGHYEALKNLAPCSPDSAGCEKHGTQNRFVGRLRIIPGGLNQDYGGQRTFAPIFGIEVNGGYGPDQVKFYIGSIIRIRGLNF